MQSSDLHQKFRFWELASALVSLTCIQNWKVLALQTSYAFHFASSLSDKDCMKDSDYLFSELKVFLKDIIWGARTNVICKASVELETSCEFQFAISLSDTSGMKKSTSVWSLNCN